MSLTDITGEAVLAAIAEFDRLGRDAFLKKYGFDSSRWYWLRYDGGRYDSKAIAGAAHGHLPDRSPLAAKDFSGGIGHAVTVLRRLGFEVISEPGPAPIGHRTANEIASVIGDLRPALVDGKPMLKQAVVLLWAIGRARAGEDRLLGWADTVTALAPLLETHRRDGERRHGRPDYPIAALHRAGLWDLPGRTDVPRAHGDTGVKAWFAEHAPDGGLPQSVYVLARESGHARVQMVEAIAARFFDDFEVSGLLTAVGLYDQDVATDEGIVGHEPIDPKADYARWCDTIARREAATYGRRRTRIAKDPIRLSLARRAVLVRSEGRCENPQCAQPAPDVNDRGEPLLEIDHIDQLSDGGRDQPFQMIALCPNCHRVKTYGRSRQRLIPVLAQTARDLHDRWISSAT
ncbi:HNH endonuclease signature motif containing protein [Actinoallomurus iriomotensis]|uniref:HNH nuclease domain-containing protein n=1 Tax=Actinoallomurus iriomotensis TaxID=478107 RepID=A0A9W6VJI2_9ACTN|nr:HNH endonuclease signature motif containing protein [Actinoallomurus iriomotensis]GLY74093.1 hypothetical protein Airi01_023600 [Actinoallomurus iriomotensis]